MGQSACRGKLVFNPETRKWFIRMEKDIMIPLPDEKEPLIVKHNDDGLIHKPQEVDRRPSAERKAGATVICRFRKHGCDRRIKWWGICPSTLTARNPDRLIFLSESKSSRLRPRRPLFILRRAS